MRLRNIMIALVVLLGLMVMSPGSSALKVTPVGHLAQLTTQQRQEVFQVILSQYPNDPDLARRITEQAIIVDPKNAKRLKLKIREDQPGELLSALGIVAIDDTLSDSDVFTLAGDGSFQGEANLILPLSFGTIAIFDGTPSRHEPLKLQIDLELITSRLISSTVITGPGVGRPPQVRIFDGTTGDRTARFFAYDRDFRGGVRVATGDINGDGVPDIITAPGSGSPPEVRVFDVSSGRAELLHSFFAHDPSFRGGVFVAAGDVNGDGRDEIITGSAPSGRPQVSIWTQDPFSEDIIRLVNVLLPDYRPIEWGSSAPSVCAEDVNRDGRDEIIVGAGHGAGPNVLAFDGRSGERLFDFLAYDPSFTGGVFVAAGDINGDSVADIITGPGPGIPPEVRSFRVHFDAQQLPGSYTVVLGPTLHAYERNFRGGVHVASGDVNGDGLHDIITGPGAGRPPEIRIFDGSTLMEFNTFFAYGHHFGGGVFVGGTDRGFVGN